MEKYCTKHPGQKMTLLLYSYVCDACDGKVAAPVAETKTISDREYRYQRIHLGPPTGNAARGVRGTIAGSTGTTTSTPNGGTGISGQSVQAQPPKSKSLFESLEAIKELTKALEAGNYNASPDKLVQGCSLKLEALDVVAYPSLEAMEKAIRRGSKR